MTPAASSGEGICDFCGHVNQKNWLMCDHCGRRLPWAPPEAKKFSPSEMSDEQLQVRFAPVKKRKTIFQFEPGQRLGFTPRAAVVIWVALAAIWLLFFNR